MKRRATVGRIQITDEMYARLHPPKRVVRCTAGHERPFVDEEDVGTCQAPGWIAGWCGCRENVA